MSWTSSAGDLGNINRHQDHIIGTGPLNDDKEATVRGFLEDWFFFECIPWWAKRAGMDTVAKRLVSPDCSDHAAVYKSAGAAALVPGCQERARLVANETAIVACTDVIGVDLRAAVAIVSSAISLSGDVESMVAMAAEDSVRMMVRCCQFAREIAGC